jgi:hypothetical protein
MAAAVNAKLRVIALRRGRRSKWIDDTLIFDIGKERRGGGNFVSSRTNLEVVKRLFIMNGPVKDGGGLYLHDCHNVLIINCMFLFNTAKWGGGLYLERCTNINVQNCAFIGNFALRDGGAVSVSHSQDIIFENNLLLLNAARRHSANYDTFHSTGFEFRR